MSLATLRFPPVLFLVALAPAPVHASRPSDAAIASWVKDALLEDPRVDAPPVSLRCEDGIVTLTGRVKSLAARSYAVEETEKIEGVRGVVDELEMEPAGRSDEALANDVRARMGYSGVLARHDIGIRVSGGAVQLTGSVASWSQRAHAGLLAREVRGVEAVKNELRVEPVASRSDDEIRRDVSAALDRDAYLAGLPIEVSVAEGVVTLSGPVGSAYQKRRAERRARWVANVGGVNDRLQIQWEERRGSRAARPSPTDAELAAAVRAELHEDLRIEKPFEVRVSVSGGDVVLRGSVPTPYERRLGERDARDLVGVRRVTNEISVQREARPDAEIERDVRWQLASDWALSDLGVDIRVEGGAVTLSGRVEDHFRRAHAEDLAARVKGVLRVVNEIAVAPWAPVPDTVLAQRIRDRLASNWATRRVAGGIGVSADHGIARLTGGVDSGFERREAERVALRTRGVLGVMNELAPSGPWWDEGDDDPSRAYGDGAQLELGPA